MNNEWYVEKWLDITFIDRTPHAMTKYEADMLVKMAKGLLCNLLYTFKVVHKNNLSKNEQRGQHGR